MAGKGKTKMAQTVVKKTKVATSAPAPHPPNRLIEAVRLPDDLIDNPPQIPKINSMGIHFEKFPFGYAKKDEHHEFVNKILSYGLRLQKEDDIPCNPGFVIQIVCRCLLKAKRIEVKVQRGERTIAGKPPEPHMWIEVNGNIVDNTYSRYTSVEDIESLEKDYPHCYEVKELQCDLEEVVSSSCDLNLGKDGKTAVKRVWYEYFVTKPDYALAMSLNQEQCSNFFFKIHRHMWENHKYTIIGVDPGVRYCCWNCEKFPSMCDKLLGAIIVGDVETAPTSAENHWKFQQCNNCLVANYCSGICQKEDWEKWHGVCCMSKGSVYIAPRNRDGPELQYTCLNLNKGDVVSVKQ